MDFKNTLELHLDSMKSKDCDLEGNIIKVNYYLNLIFRKQDEKWFLIHDQNTVYK